MNKSSSIMLHDERGPPPHFAGRRDELAALRHRLDITLRERDAAVNGVLLISGIPGIGKTHLASHFVQQKVQSGKVEALALGANGLASAEGLLVLIGRAMGAEGEFVRAAGIDDRVIGVRASVAGIVSGGVTVDAPRPSLEFFHMLRATKDLPAWRDKALVLVADEVQNVDSRSAGQLQVLHEGQHGCPILTIAAGLQHSESVLSRNGISRMSHRRLGLLTEDETVEAVYQGLTNLGVGVSEETAEQLSAASMRFPQHVHGNIEAAYQVHKTRGEVDSTEAVAEALRRGRQARDRYYEDRISATGMGAYTFYPLAEHLTNERQTDITRANAEAVIGEDAVDAAVHHGVLTMGEHGLLSFGIPSFHTHMIRKATAYRERLARPAPTEVPTP